MTKVFRKGAVGAMMDEYERAVVEISDLIAKMDSYDFEAVRDRETKDEDCRSIQTVVRHVVRAGYGYATMIRGAFGEQIERPEVPLGTPAEVRVQLAEMMAFTEATLADKWDLSEERMNAVEIHARWGPTYDFEQIMEHAIVHVLRHRRQLERFLTEPQFQPE
jgi:uncharacterized damage-inducible protein DinB